MVGIDRRGQMKLDYVYTLYREKKMGFLFEDGVLTEAHLFCEEENASRVGEICTAVVERVVPAIDGVFLIGPEGRKLFMHLKDEQQKIILLRRRSRTGNVPLKAGDTLLVQITADAQKQKLYEATSRLTLTGETVIVNRTGQIGISKKMKDEEKRESLKAQLKQLMDEQDPEGEFGVILRTAAAGFSSDVICEETISLLCKLKELIQRAETTPEYKILYQKEDTPEMRVRRLMLSGSYDTVKVHTDLPFDASLLPEGTEDDTVHRITEKESSPLILFSIPTQLEKAMRRKVFLSDGGYLYLDKTEAMTVIDVNSGKAIHGKEHEEEALAANKLAAREIARLIRLRNLSGIILVDFISMKKEESNRELLHFLKQITAGDSSPVNVVDMTRLGLVEMTRKKKDAPLSERLPGLNTDNKYITD